ncbi:PspC domain-containing protein [Sphingomonas sp. RG327]|uniref:PspC domain-containing protein n=1 Tax=Sphingomonas anseongensis TaxID=2908207 RepID=A0ABT0RGR6_9SPHN|nr:PspC domain-containing protein [Sphingomonas anseongensis]MCL6679465.1 PspC domain-containing protein [Sphingomonas anseongensis]
MTNRFIVNRREAKVMGVGAGIADYTGIDPLIVRLGLVAALLLTGPVVIFLYVITGLVAAER